MTERRATWIFLALAFGISWSIALAGYLYIPQGGRASVAIGVLFMAGPALAAVITQRLLRLPLWELGPFVRWNRWLPVAVVLPIAFTLAWLAMVPLVPGLDYVSDTSSLRDNVLRAVPAQQRATAEAALVGLGDALAPLLLAQLVVGGVLAGTTINAVAAFGEELGWRGLLHRTLGGWGLWRRAAFIGLFWGLWHLPMVVQGHNYPQHPLLGILAMMAFCLLLSPLFEFVRERSGALLAPVWMHGVMNALGGAALFVSGSELLRGPAGLRGCSRSSRSTGCCGSSCGASARPRSLGSTPPPRTRGRRRERGGPSLRAGRSARGGKSPVPARRGTRSGASRIAHFDRIKRSRRRHPDPTPTPTPTEPDVHTRAGPR
jgi:membrane protease YdiL (CAAX protease family)